MTGSAQASSDVPTAMSEKCGSPEPPPVTSLSSMNAPSAPATESRYTAVLTGLETWGAETTVAVNESIRRRRPSASSA